MAEPALPGWISAGAIDDVPLWRRTSEPVYVAATDRDQLAFRRRAGVVRHRRTTGVRRVRRTKEDDAGMSLTERRGLTPSRQAAVSS
jgi:hypothetical protein